MERKNIKGLQRTLNEVPLTHKHSVSDLWAATRDAMPLGYIRKEKMVD